MRWGCETRDFSERRHRIAPKPVLFVDPEFLRGEGKVSVRLINLDFPGFTLWEAREYNGMAPSYLTPCPNKLQQAAEPKVVARGDNGVLR